MKINIELEVKQTEEGKTLLSGRITPIDENRPIGASLYIDKEKFQKHLSTEKGRMELIGKITQSIKEYVDKSD